MLTFLKSRSRWIVAPVAGVTAAAALATVTLASGSLPGDFLNAANTSHRTCPVNPGPVLKTATACGPGSAALIQRERKIAAGGTARPAQLPASVWRGPAQSPLSPGEQNRLQRDRQLRTTVFGWPRG